MPETDYDQTIADYLRDKVVTYNAVYVGQTKRDGWDCDAWRVRFIVDTPFHTEDFDYYTGLGLRSPAPEPTHGRPAPLPHTLLWEQLEKKRKPIAPKAAAVLSALTLDADAGSRSFEDWCADFGHDTDSRKALNLYLECQQTAAKLRRVRMDVTELRELLADY